MAREVRLPAGTEYLSVVEAAVHIATNLHPFTPYSEAPTDVIARIRYKATFEAMRDKMVRMVKSQQLRTIDKLTLLTKEYQPSGLLMELDFTFDKLVDMKISLSQFIDICKDEQLSVFVDPNYHLIPPEPKPEPIEPKPAKVSSERKRKDNLTRAIEAAIKSFGCKPSFYELWQFFINDGDETGIIHDFTDEKITWMDTKGKLHDTTKKALANRLPAY